jgi:hypothetical protein
MIMKALAITDDTVIKTDDPVRMRTEAYKTMRAFEIGCHSGLFRVPRVLDYDESKGVLVLERLRNVAPFRSVTQLSGLDQGRGENWIRG